MSKRVLALSAIAASAVLVGCSSGSDSGPDTAADPQGALQDSAQQWVDGFYSGDASDAYVLFTADCQDTIEEAEFKAMADFVQVDPPNIADVTVKVDGDVGTVTYTEDGESSGAMPWVIEDGQWRTSDCTLRD